MVLLGGAGTIFGPAIGAAVFLVMEEVVWRNFLAIHAAVLGLIIVALIFFMPNGILGLVRRRQVDRKVGAGAVSGQGAHP